MTTRRRRWVRPGGIAGVAALLLAAGCSTPNSDDSAGSIDAGSAVGRDSASPDADAGRTTWDVVEVVDGDTIRVATDDGPQPVRVVGINTPESGECLSDESTAAVGSLVGDRVHLVMDVSDVDQYGRWLRFVETPDGDDVGAALVANGLAISRRYEPDTSRNDYYDELQQQARDDGLGMWAPDACGAVSDAGAAFEVEINADAPGDDNDNLNGEWVRFTNLGTTDVDLDGWQVADESASHRFVFDALVLGAGASVTVYTGCGTDSATERYWCDSDSAVWNNSGDTVFLRDPAGNIVLAESYQD